MNVIALFTIESRPKKGKGAFDLSSELLSLGATSISHGKRLLAVPIESVFHRRRRRCCCWCVLATIAREKCETTETSLV